MGKGVNSGACCGARSGLDGGDGSVDRFEEEAAAAAWREESMAGVGEVAVRCMVGDGCFIALLDEGRFVLSNCKKERLGDNGRLPISVCVPRCVCLGVCAQEESNEKPVWMDLFLTDTLRMLLLLHTYRQRDREGEDEELYLAEPIQDNTAAAGNAPLCV